MSSKPFRSAAIESFNLVQVGLMLGADASDRWADLLNRRQCEALRSDLFTLQQIALAARADGAAVAAQYGVVLQLLRKLAPDHGYFTADAFRTSVAKMGAEMGEIDQAGEAGRLLELPGDLTRPPASHAALQSENLALKRRADDLQAQVEAGRAALAAAEAGAGEQVAASELAGSAFAAGYMALAHVLRNELKFAAPSSPLLGHQVGERISTEASRVFRESGDLGKAFLTAEHCRSRLDAPSPDESAAAHVLPFGRRPSVAVDEADLAPAH